MLDETIFTAADLMSRDVATVHPEATLLQAVKLMAGRHVSGLPVVDDAGAVVGMICEGDLVRWHEGYTERQARWLDMLAEGTELSPEFLQGIREHGRTVRSVMSSAVISVTEGTPARDIARLMHSKSIKRVPVLREGKLVGIVARSDLVRALAQKLEEAPVVPPAAAPTVDEALRRGREQPGH